MWLWTLDEKLLNLNQVETLEVAGVYGEGEGLDALENPESEPSSYEIVAFLASGDEAVLYWHEQEEVIYQAFELLAEFIGAHDMIDSFSQGEVLSLSGLMKKVDETSKN